jgi:hypothetical protein
MLVTQSRTPWPNFAQRTAANFGRAKITRQEKRVCQILGD